MSITTRLSRAAELRLIKLARKRVAYPFGAQFRYIHESDFDRWLAEEKGIKVDYEYAEIDGSLELPADRVIVEIEGVPVYDTQHREPEIRQGIAAQALFNHSATIYQGGDLGFDKYDDAVSCRWIDHLNRRGMVRQFRDNKYEFCSATAIPLVKLLTFLREVGMPSTEDEARAMISEGVVLFDGQEVKNPDAELDHGFGANVSLREWQKGHSIRVYIIYGVGSHIPTAEATK